VSEDCGSYLESHGHKGHTERRVLHRKYQRNNLRDPVEEPILHLSHEVRLYQLELGFEIEQRFYWLLHRWLEQLLKAFLFG
jgi:hypothetical protein